MVNSKWNEIWVAYRKDASLSRYFVVLLARSDRLLTWMALLSFEVFVCACYWFFSSKSMWLCIFLMLMAVGFLYLAVEEMRSTVFSGSYYFSAEESYRSARFDMFRYALYKRGIGVDEIANNFVNLEAEIEYASGGFINAKRVYFFFVTLLVAVFVGLINAIGSVSFSLNFFSIALFAFVFFMILSFLLRTHEEKLRELKTFMVFFITEGERTSQVGGGL